MTSGFTHDGIDPSHLGRAIVTVICVLQPERPKNVYKHNRNLSVIGLLSYI